jgi:PAS domain S-box-containing protein
MEYSHRPAPQFVLTSAANRIAVPFASFVRVLTVLAGLAGAAMASAAPGKAEPVVVGVLAFRPKPQTLAQWQPLEAALKRALPGRDFRVEALSYPELDQAVAGKRVAFVLTNPGHYVQLARRGELSSPLATLTVHENGQRASMFGGVIFCRAETAGIATLRDLRGKTVAFPSTESLGGYQMQAYELSLLGIRVQNDLKLVATGMPHDKVVATVLSGQADAGFVRSGMLEGLARDGKLDLGRIRILNRQSIPGFPVQVSTRLYPEWAFSAVPDVDEHLARHVAAALFLLEDDLPTVAAIGIHGFNVPANYAPVEDLLRELRLPPFEKAPSFTLKDVWTRYRWQALGASLVVVLISALVFRVHLTNRKLESERRVSLARQRILNESEARYRHLTEGMKDVVWILDVETLRFLYVSPSVTPLRGYTPEEILAEPMDAALTAETAQRLKSDLNQRVEKARAAGFPPDLFQTHEVEQPCKDGSLVWTEVVTRLCLNERTGRAELHGVTRDITGRRRLESERAELEARAHQLRKAESLGVMAGSIAHHFNNKLQSVMAILDVLSTLPRDRNPAPHLDLARRATEKAAEISKMMLVYLGHAQGDREPRLLSGLCRESLQHLSAHLPEGVRLAVELPAAGPVVLANAEQVQQVVSNLVTNAWEALGDSGGTVRIRLASQAAGEIPALNRFPVGWQPEQPQYAVLEVADSGSGVAEADIAKLFDPFFSTKFTGRGLGLPVALGIVSAHGGAITVDSGPGRGSAFRIHLPLSAEAVVPDVETAAPGSRHATGGTILLVDDDELVLGSTSDLLESMGFTVLPAKNGQAAVEMFRQYRDGIRCVITDLTMPIMDGWQTLAAIRGLDRSACVILASGYDRAQVMAGAHTEVPDAFLAKPYDRHDLDRVLDQVLHPSSAPA